MLALRKSKFNGLPAVKRTLSEQETAEETEKTQEVSAAAFNGLKHVLWLMLVSDGSSPSPCFPYAP